MSLGERVAESNEIINGMSDGKVEATRGLTEVIFAPRRLWKFKIFDNSARNCCSRIVNDINYWTVVRCKQYYYES